MRHCNVAGVTTTMAPNTVQTCALFVPWMLDFHYSVSH